MLGVVILVIPDLSLATLTVMFGISMLGREIFTVVLAAKARKEPDAWARVSRSSTELVP